MNIFKLSWKNLIHRPLSMLLSVLLFTLGVGLITLLLLLNKQLQSQFDKNQAGINLVLGAKGSPLQLILNSMYHIDAPNGNIPIKQIRPFLNPKHPLISVAVPLSIGDNYKGYRIIGTNHTLVDSLYHGKIQSGKRWNRDMEVSIGASVAQQTGLKIGDKFRSSHGLVNDGLNEHADSEPFVVVGVFEKTGSVMDQLILTNTESVWQVHDGHDHNHDEEGVHKDHDEHDHGEEGHNHNSDAHDHSDHDDHDHHDHGDHENHNHQKSNEGHEHDHHNHDGHDHDHMDERPAERIPLMDQTEKEITALLLKFKMRNFQTLSMGRNINENTELLAADPVYQINRLYYMMGVGTSTLRNIALIIVIVSALSIFISLFNALKERKYEMALMRVMGATRDKILLMVVLEGLLLAALGCLLGIIAAHIGMEVLGSYMKEAYRYPFTGKIWLQEEWLVILAALATGVVAALIPAFQASNTDISETLTDS